MVEAGPQQETTGNSNDIQTAALGRNTECDQILSTLKWISCSLEPIAEKLANQRTQEDRDKIATCRKLLLAIEFEGITIESPIPVYHIASGDLVNNGLPIHHFQFVLEKSASSLSEPSESSPLKVLARVGGICVVSEALSKAWLYSHAQFLRPGQELLNALPEACQQLLFPSSADLETAYGSLPEIQPHMSWKDRGINLFRQLQEKLSPTTNATMIIGGTPVEVSIRACFPDEGTYPNLIDYTYFSGDQGTRSIPVLVAYERNGSQYRAVVPLHAIDAGTEGATITNPSWTTGVKGALFFSPIKEFAHLSSILNTIIEDRAKYPTLSEHIKLYPVTVWERTGDFGSQYFNPRHHFKPNNSECSLISSLLRVANLGDRLTVDEQKIVRPLIDSLTEAFARDINFCSYDTDTNYLFSVFNGNLKLFPKKPSELLLRSIAESFLSMFPSLSFFEERSDDKFPGSYPQLDAGVHSLITGRIAFIKQLSEVNPEFGVGFHQELVRRLSEGSQEEQSQILRYWASSLPIDAQDLTQAQSAQLQKLLHTIAEKKLAKVPHLIDPLFQLIRQASRLVESNIHSQVAITRITRESRDLKLAATADTLQVSLDTAPPRAQLLYLSPQRLDDFPRYDDVGKPIVNGEQSKSPLPQDVQNYGRISQLVSSKRLGPHEQKVAQKLLDFYSTKVNALN